MKKIKIELELFKYDELEGEAKKKAFDEHYIFLSSIPYDYETEDEIKEYVEDSITINEYLFFKNGEMADITHYTGKHPKEGKTELKIFNKIIEVE